MQFLKENKLQPAPVNGETELNLSCKEQFTDVWVGRLLNSWRQISNFRANAKKRVTNDSCNCHWFWKGTIGVVQNFIRGLKSSQFLLGLFVKRRDDLVTLKFLEQHCSLVSGISCRSNKIKEDILQSAVLHGKKSVRCVCGGRNGPGGGQSPPLFHVQAYPCCNGRLTTSYAKPKVAALQPSWQAGFCLYRSEML